VVVPQTSLTAVAEVGNEGAPFRCLGLHTRWKAPLEAQTRFSEDPAIQFYRIESKTAQPEHYRQAKVDSQNLSNIASRWLAVNWLRLTAAV
jgi:hypothetical protein